MGETAFTCGDNDQRDAQNGLNLKTIDAVRSGRGQDKLLGGYELTDRWRRFLDDRG